METIKNNIAVLVALLLVGCSESQMSSHQASGSEIDALYALIDRNDEGPRQYSPPQVKFHGVASTGKSKIGGTTGTNNFSTTSNPKTFTTRLSVGIPANKSVTVKVKPDAIPNYIVYQTTVTGPTDSISLTIPSIPNLRDLKNRMRADGVPMVGLDVILSTAGGGAQQEITAQCIEVVSEHFSNSYNVLQPILNQNISANNLSTFWTTPVNYGSRMAFRGFLSNIGNVNSICAQSILLTNSNDVGWDIVRTSLDGTVTNALGVHDFDGHADYANVNIEAQMDSSLASPVNNWLNRYSFTSGTSGIVDADLARIAGNQWLCDAAGAPVYGDDGLSHGTLPCRGDGADLLMANSTGDIPSALIMNQDYGPKAPDDLHPGYYPNPETGNPMDPKFPAYVYQVLETDVGGVDWSSTVRIYGADLQTTLSAFQSVLLVNVERTGSEIGSGIRQKGVRLLENKTTRPGAVSFEDKALYNLLDKNGNQFTAVQGTTSPRIYHDSALMFDVNDDGLQDLILGGNGNSAIYPDGTFPYRTDADRIFINTGLDLQPGGQGATDQVLEFRAIDELTTDTRQLPPDFFTSLGSCKTNEYKAVTLTAEQMAKNGSFEAFLARGSNCGMVLWGRNAFGFWQKITHKINGIDFTTPSNTNIANFWFEDVTGDGAFEMLTVGANPPVGITPINEVWEAVATDVDASYVFNLDQHDDLDLASFFDGRWYAMQPLAVQSLYGIVPGSNNIPDPIKQADIEDADGASCNPWDKSTIDIAAQHGFTTAFGYCKSLGYKATVYIGAFAVASVGLDPASGYLDPITGRRESAQLYIHNHRFNP